MIPFFDYRPYYLKHQADINAAMARVLASGQLILGSEVDQFEQAFAQYTGAHHGIGVNSGTDALVLALRVMGIGPGDEVITVANTAVPTVAAIRAVGATPRFADILESSFVMDPESLSRTISPKTRAVIPVHLFGHPAPMDAIMAMAQEHQLRVIEDCAQAHGARYQGQHVGTFGDIGCFSFYPTKNLGAFGDGGICITNDEMTARELRSQRTYGLDADGHARHEGLNSRLDEIQAAILSVKLTTLDHDIQLRRQLAATYVTALQDSLCTTPEETDGVQHAYHLYVVRCSDRDSMIQKLDQAEIGWGIHYPLPIHLMDAYQSLGYQRGDLPVTEAAANQILSLPIFPELGEANIQQIIQALCAQA